MSEFLIRQLYDAWRDCSECQYNNYVCSDHMYLIEPILAIEAESRGESVVDFQVDTNEEEEYLRDHLTR